MKQRVHIRMKIKALQHNRLDTSGFLSKTLDQSKKNCTNIWKGLIKFSGRISFFRNGQTDGNRKHWNRFSLNFHWRRDARIAHYLLVSSD